MHPLALSLYVAGCATILAGVLGVAIGAALATRRFVGRELLDALTAAPLVLPPTVLGYYLLLLLGRRGAFGRAFEALTHGPLVFTRTAAVLAATLGALPFVVAATRAAIEAVDPALPAIARTLGASPLRALLTIQLPLARAGIVAGLLLGFARSLGDFGVTLMVAGDLPGETQTASLAIYDALQAGRDGDARALALALTIVALGLMIAVRRLERRWR